MGAAEECSTIAQQTSCHIRCGSTDVSYGIIADACRGFTQFKRHSDRDLDVPFVVTKQMVPCGD